MRLSELQNTSGSLSVKPAPRLVEKCLKNLSSLFILSVAKTFSSEETLMISFYRPDCITVTLDRNCPKCAIKTV